jgi:hypothetical protein
MKRLAILLIVLSMLCALAACGAGEAEVKKADDFLSGLSTLDSADAIKDVDKLVELTAPVINIHANAFDLSRGWEERTHEYEKYVHIFGSDGKVYIYVTDGRITKAAFTFVVGTNKAIFDSADILTGIYGEPEKVQLNGAPSSNVEVKRAIEDSSKPDFRYNYTWTPNLKGRSLSVYESYYYASGVNFCYIVIKNPD